MRQAGEHAIDGGADLAGGAAVAAAAREEDLAVRRRAGGVKGGAPGPPLGVGLEDVGVGRLPRTKADDRVGHPVEVVVRHGRRLLGELVPESDLYLVELEDRSTRPPRQTSPSPTCPDGDLTAEFGRRWQPAVVSRRRMARQAESPPPGRSRRGPLPQPVCRLPVGGDESA